MAKKSNKAAGIAVAVGGVAALGLAAYALSQSKGNGQKEASQLLSSGGYGGGATGGYSDAFTDVTTPTTQPSISDTVADVLNKVTQTPQAQPTPIIITPSTDDLVPIIEAVDNPQDERSDVKQVASNTDLMQYAFQNYSGKELISALDSIGFTTTPTVQGQSNAVTALMSSLNTTTTPQSNTAVEYSPFDFKPTPKQADYTAYNQGKTGGSTANTPKTDNKNTGKTSDNRSQSAGAQALTSSLSNGTAKTGKQTMQVTSPVSTAINAAGQALSAGVSAVGSFFSGLFGGK